MEFSKNFKAFWWAILTLGIGYYLFSRLDQLQAGDPTWFDGLVFIIWIALGLGPFFKEMEFLGFKLKQDIEQLKEHVTTELTAIRDVVQSQDQRQSVTSTFNLGYPAPTDAQLPNIQEQIRAAVREAVGGFAKDQAGFVAVGEVLPPDIQFLASSRIAIERELRSIYRPLYLTSYSANSRRQDSVSRIAQNLVNSEVITPDLAHAIREVYAVCSLAMHGEDVSPAKIKFVKESAPELLAALRAISSRYA